ncbi:MAG: hypothetical protein GX801_03550, partial [Fibrobacter sp.]|nr:hypothetical protein [Fibrobacter sp.]
MKNIFSQKLRKTILVIMGFSAYALAQSPLTNHDFSALGANYNLWNNPSLMAYTQNLTWAAELQNIDSKGLSLQAGLHGANMGLSYFYKRVDSTNFVEDVSALNLTSAMGFWGQRAALGLRLSAHKGIGFRQPKFALSPGLNIRPTSWLSLA